MGSADRCRWCEFTEGEHPDVVGVQAAPIRHAFTPKDGLARNPNTRVDLPGHEKMVDSGTSDQPKRGNKSLTRSKGRPKLTDEQRRESKKRRSEKQRELMRRRRADEQAQRRMPLFSEED
jgi:hypothetical protein